ncbi:MAG: HDOD domain-containing protein, partial [SAR324 cluster bacterium]|nr:HDOD domain-containing protein [SAR324 cluster bacterium]
MVRERRDPLNLIAIPPNKANLEAAQAALTEHGFKAESLAQLVVKDPVLLLELYKTISSTTYARGYSVNMMPVSQMVTLLGVKILNELCQNLKGRSLPDSSELATFLEKSRAECLKISNIARLIGNSVDPQQAEQCGLIGLFARFGDMVAVLYLKEHYISAVQTEGNRTRLAYRLAKEYAFDLERAGLRYLSLHGLPEKILACIDRDSQINSTELVNRKLVVLSSIEVVTAYEEAKWDRYSPDKALPVQSHFRPLRYLGLNYEKLYQDLSDFLSKSSQKAQVDSESKATESRISDRESISKATSRSLAEAGTKRTLSGRLVPVAPPAKHAAIERGSVGFLGKAHPLVVACVRGVRNAENLFSVTQRVSFLDTVVRLIGPLLKTFPDLGSVLYKASEFYLPLATTSSEDEILTTIVEGLSAKEVVSIIVLSYLAGEFSKHCEVTGWDCIARKLPSAIEIGRTVGATFSDVGPGYGMLLTGVRHMSLAALLFHDAKNFEHYIKYLSLSSRPYDMIYEKSKWGYDHLSYCGSLLQYLGFGLEMVKAFDQFRSFSQITEIKVRNSAVVLHWAEVIQKSGTALGDSNFLQQSGIGKDDVIKVDNEIGRLTSRLKNNYWLSPIREQALV